MSSLELVAVIAVALALVVSLWCAKLLDRALMHALVLMSFAAGVLKTTFPLRFAIALVAAVLIAYLLTQRRQSVAVGRAILAVLLVVAGVLFFLIAPFGVEVSDPFFRYFVMLPALFALGVTIASDPLRRQMLARIFVGWALAFSVLAAVESLSGELLLPRSDLTRDLVRSDLQRAILLSEHPLVLSVLFVMALPLAWNAIKRPGVRVASVAVLLVGILATGSRGALVLAIAWALIEWMRRRFTLKVVRPAVVVVVGVGVVLLASGALTAGELSNVNADAASAEYRLQLYAVLGDSLVTTPFGWGVTGLPPGVHVINSHFGPKDIADTVDSEIALAVFEFGIGGVIALVLVGAFLLSARSLIHPEGQSAILCFAAGFYVALHSWTGLMLILALVVGIVWGTRRSPTISPIPRVRNRGRSQKQTALLKNGRTPA
jgi:hypothetical protein